MLYQCDHDVQQFKPADNILKGFSSPSVQIDAIQKLESGDEMLLLFKLLRIIQRRIVDLMHTVFVL